MNKGNQGQKDAKNLAFSGACRGVILHHISGRVSKLKLSSGRAI